MTRTWALRGAILGFSMLGPFGVLSTSRAQTPPPTGAIIPGSPTVVRVDANSGGGSSNLNHVLEPGETVLVEPAYLNGNLSQGWGGQTVASNFNGPSGAVYSILDSAAAYSISDPYPASAYCYDCLVLSVDNPATRPAAHWDATFDESGNSSFPATWILHIGASFADVPTSYPFYGYIERLFHNSVTAGCGAGNFCPTGLVTRAQMAAFLLKAKHTSAYVPPVCTGIFTDVSCPSLFADWIEELSAEGITGGCGVNLYCPGDPASRAQMAVFLLKAKHGSGYVPPSCMGVFNDVSCPSLFADWIEQLAAEGITGGCGSGNYCPNDPITRGQMAVFLVKTFGLTFDREGS
jgi:hypothetical protein